MANTNKGDQFEPDPDYVAGKDAKADKTHNPSTGEKLPPGVAPGVTGPAETNEDGTPVDAGGQEGPDDPDEVTNHRLKQQQKSHSQRGVGEQNPKNRETR